MTRQVAARPRIALWGAGAPETRAVVDYFVARHLDAVLAELWQGTPAARRE